MMSLGLNLCFAHGCKVHRQLMRKRSHWSRSTAMRLSFHASHAALNSEGVHRQKSFIPMPMHPNAIPSSCSTSACVTSCWSFFFHPWN